MATAFFPNYDEIIITSRFGEIRTWGAHDGLDLVAKDSEGRGRTDYITAQSEGTVIDAGYNAISGYYCKIRHSAAFCSIYCHMKTGSMRVSRGDKVKRGDILGYMGRTGRAIGAHLHYGVEKYGIWVDPEPYLDTDLSLDTGFDVVSVRRLLMTGAVGEECRLLQSLLNYHGANLDTDGIFGTKTAAALRDFQSQRGIDTDAVAGPVTWGELLKTE